MHRFFVPVDSLREASVLFQDPIAHQIIHVLHLGQGDKVIALDGSPVERVVRITAIGKHTVEGQVEAILPAREEPSCDLSLFIGMTQRAKFEWVLQKGTELGVNAFIPVITTRSLVRETAAEPRRMERWQGILREAAEQSLRSRIPHLHEIQSFPQALSSGSTGEAICLIPWEGETSKSLMDALSYQGRDPNPKISLLIGPEGGFTNEEVRQASEKGWVPISLGPRILRMETAALAAVTMILYELGEFNPPGGGVTNS